MPKNGGVASSGRKDPDKVRQDGFTVKFVRGSILRGALKSWVLLNAVLGQVQSLSTVQKSVVGSCSSTDACD